MGQALVMQELARKHSRLKKSIDISKDSHGLSDRVSCLYHCQCIIVSTEYVHVLSNFLLVRL